MNKGIDLEKRTKNYCECYKKLSYLGIPLYKDEENEDFDEIKTETSIENACKFPKYLKIDENIKEYPNIEELELSDVFRKMSRIIFGMSDFDVNALSFWILDMFIEGLWTAQNAGMHYEHQKATLLWIAYCFNYIQKKSPGRRSFFMHLKKIIFSAEEEKWKDSINIPIEGCTSLHSYKESESDGESHSEAIRPIWELPLPPSLEEVYDEGLFAKASSSDVSSKTTLSETSSLSSLTPIDISKKNVNHMKVILEILYRIFGRGWVFGEIQSCFFDQRNLETFDLPFVMNTPKPKQKVELKEVKSGKKNALPEKSIEEVEAQYEKHKNDYILPLEASEEAKYYHQLFFSQTNSEKKGKSDKKK